MFFKTNKDDPENMDLQDLFGSGKIVLEPDANMRGAATAAIQFVTAYTEAGFTREEAFQVYMMVFLEGLRSS